MKRDSTSRVRVREVTDVAAARHAPEGNSMLACAIDETVAPAPPARPTVLVVDDDELVRESLAVALDLEGYEPLLAAHGVDALLALRTGPRPDVILLDLEMPVMPGWEFREAQLRDPALAAIPVIVISSSARTVKAHLRLHKPFDLDVLLRAIREVV